MGRWEPQPIPSHGGAAGRLAFVEQSSGGAFPVWSRIGWAASPDGRMGRLEDPRMGGSEDTTFAPQRKRQNSKLNGNPPKSTGARTSGLLNLNCTESA